MCVYKISGTDARPKRANERGFKRGRALVENYSVLTAILRSETPCSEDVTMLSNSQINEMNLCAPVAYDVMQNPRQHFQVSTP